MAMVDVRQFTIAPSLPPDLEFLEELAYNLYWTWHYDAIELFRRLDQDLWETCDHNPVLMLGQINQQLLEIKARDESFLAQLERVKSDYEDYMTRKSWYQKKYPEDEDATIAYFSFEFGLTECLHTYSGGLGVLSGDHLKTCSDLGIPLVGAGIIYQKGYFHQYLNADGWQQEDYPLNDFYTLPLRLQKDENGNPVKVSVEYPGVTVHAQIWKVQVGRVPLYLLDTNIADNAQPEQDITDQLYGGDVEMRVKQEIMLGIGGTRALRAMGYDPVVYHVNEGHAAFSGLERIRMTMEEKGVSFYQAKELVCAGNVFTTHTPVPAGNDYFPSQLIDKYFTDYYGRLGISRQEFLGLGRANPTDDRESFCMTILALKLAAFSNGVSQLHGKVARRMWQGVWPRLPEDEIPVGAITNGIHTPSWVSNDIAGLFTRYLSSNWKEELTERTMWARVDQIPPGELWRTHERRRERLVAFARNKLREQLIQRGSPPSEVAAAEEVLDPEALTIGFARRFATYKRGTLLLRDPGRLAELLNHPDRPVQLIFAGKAHPRDDAGKDLIRQIVHAARSPEFRNHIVFLEDYDMTLARYLVTGVDVWLNTPRRPLEASGTSGMKVTFNGALNVSILDGWWDEAYRLNTGWAIGSGEEYGDLNYQDEVESNALYHLLEGDIIPLFYKRGRDGLPREWIQLMKNSIKTHCPQFNTARMLQDYAGRFYVPAMHRHAELAHEDMLCARNLADWRQKMSREWPKIRFEEVTPGDSEGIKVGDELAVKASVHLGGLSPDDVSIELYHGPLDSKGQIVGGEAIKMIHTGPDDGDLWAFEGSIPCVVSGRHGYMLRVLPHHEDLPGPYIPGLIVWG